MKLGLANAEVVGIQLNMFPADARLPGVPAASRLFSTEVPVNVKKLFPAGLLAALGLAAVAAGIALAEPAKDAKKEAAAPPEFKLPPGWTEADMQAMILASMPGKQQKYLADGAGEWLGKTTMWMGPDGEEMKSECTSKVTPIMDGRYTKVEIAGDFPGMGPYSGHGMYGFDNVMQHFVSTWIDNHSTGIMTGVGKLSEDGKTLTWTYTHSCPITKKPTVMREVETITGSNSKTLEMYGADPKSGKEYKMMRIELTRK